MKTKSDEFEAIKKFYNKSYYGGAITHSSLPWHCRKIGGKLGSLQGKSVLDIACGTGEWLEFFQGKGASIAGVDISEVAIDVCKDRFSEGAFFCSSAEELPFEAAQFDVITCMGSLEHFLDKPKALLEMRRVAKKGASFVLLVPNAGFLTRRLGLYHGTQQVQVKEDVYELNAWERLFNEAGLKVVVRLPDLHPFSFSWIMRGKWLVWPLRAVQAMALFVWPISWQYQVYHFCVVDE